MRTSALVAMMTALTVMLAFRASAGEKKVEIRVLSAEQATFYDNLIIQAQRDFIELFREMEKTLNLREGYGWKVVIEKYYPDGLGRLPTMVVYIESNQLRKKIEAVRLEPPYQGDLVLIMKAVEQTTLKLLEQSKKGRR